MRQPSISYRTAPNPGDAGNDCQGSSKPSSTSGTHIQELPVCHTPAVCEKKKEISSTLSSHGRPLAADPARKQRKRVNLRALITGEGLRSERAKGQDSARGVRELGWLWPHRVGHKLGACDEDSAVLGMVVGETALISMTSAGCVVVRGRWRQRARNRPRARR